MGSRKCALRDVPPPADAVAPRWLRKKGKRAPRVGKADPRQRTSAARARNLAKVLAKYRMHRRKPKVEKEPWQPPYVREDSPGRKLAKRRPDERRLTYPQVILEGTEDAARDELIRLGALRKWPKKPCLSCDGGRYGSMVKQDKSLYRCSGASKGATRHYVSLTRGSAFQGTGSSWRRCYNVLVGYAARRSPTDASIATGLNRRPLTRLWKYFRAAEAWRGVEHRTQTIFSGTAERPAEIELDETAIKKVPFFDGDERTGTMHHSIFGMKQRGSRKCVLYMLQPRFVPLRVDGAGASVPPPSVDEILPFLQTHIGDWCVIHCDGARAYAALLEDLLATRDQVFLDQVDHSGHQWTRFA